MYWQRAFCREEEHLVSLPGGLCGQTVAQSSGSLMWGSHFCCLLPSLALVLWSPDILEASICRAKAHESAVKTEVWKNNALSQRRH